MLNKEMINNKYIIITITCKRMIMMESSWRIDKYLIVFTKVDFLEKANFNQMLAIQLCMLYRKPLKFEVLGFQISVASSTK